VSPLLAHLLSRLPAALLAHRVQRVEAVARRPGHCSNRPTTLKKQPPAMCRHNVKMTQRIHKDRVTEDGDGSPDSYTSTELSTAGDLRLALHERNRYSLLQCS